MIAAVFSSISRTLLIFFMTMDPAATERIYDFSIGQNGVITFIVGAIIWAFGVAWQDARNLADENAQFI